MLDQLSNSDAQYHRRAWKMDDGRVFVEATARGHRMRFWKRSHGELGCGDVIELRAMGSPRTICIEFADGYVRVKRGTWVSLHAIQRPARAILTRLNTLATATS